MKRSQRGSRVLHGLEHGKPSDEDRELAQTASSQTSLPDEGSVAGETTERRGEQSSMSAESCGQEAASSTMSATTTAPSVSAASDWHDDRKQRRKRHSKTSSLRKIQTGSASPPSESKRRISSHQSNQSLEAEITSSRREIQLFPLTPVYTPLPDYSAFTVHQGGGRWVCEDTTNSPSHCLIPGTGGLKSHEESCNTEPPSKVLGLDTQMPVSGNTSISTSLWAPPSDLTPCRRFGFEIASLSPALTSIKKIRKAVKERDDGLSSQLHELKDSSDDSDLSSIYPSPERSKFIPPSVHPCGPEVQKSLSYPEGKAGVSYTTIPSLKDVSDSPSSNITLPNPVQESSKQSSSPKPQSSLFQSCEGPEEQSAEVLRPQNRNATDNGSLPFHTPTSTPDVATSSVTGPPCPENIRGSLMDSTVSTAEDTLGDIFRNDFLVLKSQLGENHDTPEEKVPPVPASPPSATDTMPASFLLPLQRCGESSTLSRSGSMPSLSETLSTRNRKQTQRKRSQSLSDVTLQDSFERFTPEISDGGNSEIYRFLCTSPGLYQCSVTGLVFHMEGEGDVTYRIVHWDRRLLAQHHKKPAGPLFDIRCQQQSVCQLHLPHCEIRSTGACQFLSVAHVTDEGTDFILPHEITETHVVINITGFSAYGNVKDEDSPLDPIRAAVLLFYTPPVDPDPTSFLHVLLLPRNIVIRDVQFQRRERNADERYIETSPRCKLQPNQEYTLSTSPEDESVLIQPKKAEFDDEINNNYFTTFEVVLHQIMRNINLLLRESNSSLCVWERQVSLSSAAIRKPQGQSAVGLRPDMSLLSVRSSFISGVSGPVLQSLLDGLLEKRVINDSEREAAHGMQNRADKARFVFDTVRKKGEAARSEMMALLCDIDPFFSRHLGMRSDEDDEK